ncbi:L,D-transpeptidase [Ahrensia sp. 13_GOM-1096m]|uniref:L,D-transpeptidase family protein n=1 Tax=Ahrensia sp. 13_GOM-1096m TaxID=1380380 RepID=UPI0005562D68|nr:L,D-transpeptidase family protein [Ahrensia sp. 13_GOM-1096m]
MNFLRTLRVQRQPGDPCKGIIVAQNRIISCALGRSGPSVFKREGDGATPAHRPLRPISGFFRGDRVQRPKSTLSFEALMPNDGWCDAPTHPNYNMPVDLPFGASHEKMMRDDKLYDIGIILDWNMPVTGRKRYGGSAIFFHLCKSGYKSTEGCIAVEEADMRWLLQYMTIDTTIIVCR